MSARKKASETAKSQARPQWIPPHWLSLSSLAVITFLVYSTSLHGQFVFDDLSIVLQISTLMNVKTFGDAISTGTAGGWRQLLFIIYALNYYWGGLNTFGYHLLNVSLHVFNVWLVYGILSSVLRDDERHRYLALCGAA